MVSSADNVCNSYGNVKVVEDGSFEIEKSKITGLIGLNGAIDEETIAGVIHEPLRI